MTPEHWQPGKNLLQAEQPPPVSQQAEPGELRSGQMLGPYLVEHKLGQGGMGLVYQARDTRLGRPLALKLLHPQFTQDAERVQRFQQEARAASALNHPNILTIYESGENNATHFIATELVAGETLRSRLAAGPLPLTMALDIVLQVTSALVAAHQVGIIHRDLKPENIMIRPDGVVKVLDFGLAKLTERGREREQERKSDEENFPSPSVAPSLRRSLSESGLHLGTVSYLSPEQARGLVVDARSDLFSVGVVLYELLTGHQPFTGETPSDVLAAVLECEPDLLALQRANLPIELQRIVQRALAKSVAARYQTAAELLDDLKRLKQALDVSAHLQQAASEAETLTWVAAQAEGAPRSRTRAWLLCGGVLVLLLAVGIWLLPFRKNTSPLNSLAVLPFVNVANDPQLEYLADGLTESLIDSLMRLSSLRIKARSMVFGYKGRTVDPRQVGKELGVQAVVVGRVQQQGERPLIRAELIDTADGSQLWSRDYQVPLTSLLSVQEEIAREVVTRLQLSLSQQEQSVLARSQTNSATAYNLFLDGRHHWNKRNRDGITRAVELFQQAIAQDPNYALAYVGLADAYGTLGSYHLKPAKDAYPLARAAAEKAIQLDDKLGEAHATMGKIITDYYWQWPEAERAFQRAITLNPKYANGYHWYSTMLVQQGRFDEAVRAARQALELEPASVILQRQLGYVLYSATRYDEAITTLQKALALEPTHVVAQFYLGNCLLLQGNYAEALTVLAQANALIPNLPDVLALLGYTQAALGKREAALRYQAQLQEMMSQRYVSPYCVATVALGLGQLDDVFVWLEKGYEERDPHIRGLLTDPLYERVRKDPRFVALLRRAGAIS